MVQALQQLSLPSRQEVAALAERFTNMEIRLDDVDAKLDQIAKLIVETRQAAKERVATGARKSTRRQSARKSER